MVIIMTIGGNRVSPYIGKGLIPLLKSIRDELSKDFIIQGNFLRAAGGPYRRRQLLLC